MLHAHQYLFLCKHNTVGSLRLWKRQRSSSSLWFKIAASSSVSVMGTYRAHSSSACQELKKKKSFSSMPLFSWHLSWVSPGLWTCTDWHLSNMKQKFLDRSLAGAVFGSSYASYDQNGRLHHQQKISIVFKPVVTAVPRLGSHVFRGTLCVPDASAVLCEQS